MAVSTKCNCQEREDIAREGINQLITLNESGPATQCDVVQSQGEIASYHCHGSRSYMSSRKRWWFIAVSNCESKNGLALRYSLTMTNGISFWNKHFSADEFYILSTNLAALSVEIVLLFLSIVAFENLNSRQLLHKTYRLYMTALIIQIIGLTFLNTHYSYYGIDGMGSLNIKIIGSILQSMSNILSVMCLLMMGQISKIKLTIFMSAFCVSSSAFFFYEQKDLDPGREAHVYESPLGYVMMVMRCAAWIVFLYACHFNIKHSPEKSTFYYPLVVFYTPWFLTTPIVVITSTYFIDDLEREKVISLVETSFTIIGHVFFLIITVLNLSNKSLENHIRPSQVTASVTGHSEWNETDTNKSLLRNHHGDKQNVSKYANSEIFTVPGGFKEVMISHSDEAMDLIYHEQQQGSQTTTFMASRQKGRKLRNSLQMFNPNVPLPLLPLPPKYLLPPKCPLPPL